jgi:ureidoglycolate lyase
VSDLRPVAIEPLTRAAFVPYGDLIDVEGVDPEPMNAGTARKFAALATIEIASGVASIGLIRAAPRALPLALAEIERHPLGSQAFVPLSPTRFLVVVAGSAEEPRPEDLRAFLATGRQGINFRRGVWHHALCALEPCDFLVVDRRETAGNLELRSISDWGLVVAEP